MTREADDADRAFEEGQNSMLRSLREARRQRDTWAQRAGESERARLAAQVERDEARAERDGLRALCDRVREARKTAPLLHTFHCARGPTEECACGIGELRAAIEALGPGGGK